MKRGKPILGLTFTLLAAVILLLAAAPASASRVGPLIPIGAPALPASCNGSAYRDAEVEPTLAVDPRNPDKLVAAWMQGPRPAPAISIVSANSSDGGRTWNQVLVPDNTQCTGGQFEEAIDPWLSYGPKGTV